jgi:hypothetical protein
MDWQTSRRRPQITEAESGWKRIARIVHECLALGDLVAGVHHGESGADARATGGAVVPPERDDHGKGIALGHAQRRGVGHVRVEGDLGSLQVPVDTRMDIEGECLRLPLAGDDIAWKSRIRSFEAVSSRKAKP